MNGKQAFALSKKYTEESLDGAGAVKGKSAYEIAVENGYSGSEKQWLDSIKGIDDSSVSSETTWSSKKIDDEMSKISPGTYSEVDNEYGGKTAIFG